MSSTRRCEIRIEEISALMTGRNVTQLASPQIQGSALYAPPSRSSIIWGERLRFLCSAARCERVDERLATARASCQCWTARMLRNCCR